MLAMFNTGETDRRQCFSNWNIHPPPARWQELDATYQRGHYPVSDLAMGVLVCFIGGSSPQGQLRLTLPCQDHRLHCGLLRYPSLLLRARDFLGARSDPQTPRAF